MTAPNLQLFLLKPGLICSMIELPALKLPGGGATAGLLTASMQVKYTTIYHKTLLFII